ncbi:MAG: NFACT RNA binding domain-containing protein [Gemmatimonadales bacterium]|jgi:hypothetical protein
MPLIFDSVLTAALARDLASRWSGRRLASLRFDRDARQVELGFRDERWVWLLHPLEGIPARLDEAAERRRRGRRERGLLDGPRRVRNVVAPPDTRQILLELDGPGDGDERLVFDLVTNRWNALLVGDGVVRSVLVPGLGGDPIAPGDAWHAAVSDRRWAAPGTAPGLDAWRDLVAELRTEDGAPARRRVAWLSSTNEQTVLGGALEASGEREAREIRDSLARYLALRDAALRESPEGWLLPEDGATRPYVSSLGLPGATRSGTPLDALAAWAREVPRIGAALRTAAESAETTVLREALEGRRQRAAKKIRALRAEVAGSRDPEELRRLGHLLLARKNDVPTGAEETCLEDFDGTPVVVPLDASLDAVGNAGAYYDRAKRLERAAARLPGRIAKAERRLATLDDALERLAAEGPDESLWKLAGGKRRNLAGSDPGRGGSAQSERLPYRVYRASSGLEIRAGRSARANDELTFGHSAPDDIWMHVREAPGSHVVLRWGRKDQNPPEADIAEAALVAAVLSRARGSNVVPVAWTRRKYVRKPRKAPPGAVVPERTQTVFVHPNAAKVERMAEQD